MFVSKIEKTFKPIQNVKILAKPALKSLIIKYKKSKKSKKRKIKKIYRREKRFFRFKKKNKFLSEFLLLLRDSLNFKFRIKFDISIRKNNIFYTELDLYKKYFLVRASAGKYNLSSTKKKLKYSSKRMMDFFLSVVRRTYVNILKKKKKVPFFRHTILNVSAPKRFRYKNFKRLFFFFKKKRFNIINLKLKKCFNGCRALKRNHKKSLSKQIFK